MHPAPSVIAFTVISGAGYGLLALLCLAAAAGQLPGTGLALAVILIALGLITAGLISSTFHLGRPDRAWRAISQWRSSWLSREGLLALMTYLPTGLALILLSSGTTPSPLLAWIIAILAVATIYCTGMIYASLKTVPQWNRGIVPLVYIALGFASGALWGLAITGLAGIHWPWLEYAAIIALIIASGLKAFEIMDRNQIEATSTAGTALGLDAATRVRTVEPAHQGKNYIMREMAFVIGRKHRDKLRLVMAVTGAVIPIVATLAVITVPAGAFAAFLALIGLASGMIGCIVERWLFFAEAEHKVTLYYGAQTV
jgi:DMSO reductase anchor subunit